MGNNPKVDIKDIGCESLNRIHMTHDTDQWRVIVNMVMVLRVP